MTTANAIKDAATDLLPSWKLVFRNGLAPLISTAGLEALKAALESDDPRLIQGATTVPPPLQCVQDWPAEAACPVGLCGWLGEGLETVGEVEEYFARLAYECDARLGEPAAVRHFLNWADATPRDEMRRELLAEVNLTLTQRL